MSAFLLMFVMLGLSGCTAATPVAVENEFADPYAPVAIRLADGTIVDTPWSAYFRKHEFLVPLSIVTDYLKRDFIVEADGGGLNVAISSPLFKMETPRLDEYLKEGVDFRLNAVSVFGVPHINLKGLEKLLNLSIARSTDGRKWVISQLPVLPAEKSPSIPRLHEPRVPFKPTGKISLVWDHFLGEPVDLAQEDKLPA